MTQADIDNLHRLSQAARSRADAYKLAGDDSHAAYHWRMTAEKLEQSAIWMRDAMRLEQSA